MALPPKFCPSCGEEFVHAARQCSDCGVELVLEPPRPSGGQVLPEADALEPLRSAPVAWIQDLAQALVEAGIACRVERAPARGSSGPAATLFVRPEDREAALPIDAAVARAAIPDLPERAESGWSEAEACPACATELAPDSEVCPECGLAFVAAE